MVEKYLTDSRWREVFLLTSGLMLTKGADTLLQEIHKKAKQYARHPKVKALLQWADQVTAGSSGAFKPASKRAIAMMISSINASARNIANIIDIASFISGNISDIVSELASASINGELASASISAFNIAITIDIASIIAISTAITRDKPINIDKLEKSGIFIELKLFQLVNQLQEIQSALKDSDITQIKKVAEQVRSDYLEAFHLTKELITYNSEELKALNNYLYGINLLLKCKQEAARLSPATWDVIESELLLPPDD